MMLYRIPICGCIIIGKNEETTHRIIEKIDILRIRAYAIFL